MPIRVTLGEGLMNIRNQMVCVWSGMTFAVLCLAGFLIADFIPPISPNLSAEEVAAIYQNNALSMRMAVLLIMTSGGFICGFAAVIAVQMKRIEGEVGALTLAELGAGSITGLVFVFAGVFWTAAAFRPDHSVEITRTLNDLGWITMLMTFAPFIVQNLSLGFCILGDNREEPVFPRWVGYYNFWVAVLFVPGGLLTFFKTGPFAWDGLFVWWIPFMVFFSWYVSMFFIVRGVVKRQAVTEASGTMATA